MPECDSHEYRKLGIDRVPTSEETEFAVLDCVRLYHVKRCVHCGDIKRDFLWATKKKVTWKDEVVDAMIEDEEFEAQ